MTVPSYTEEDVELGADAISRARLRSYTWEKLVAIVLDDLAARNRLVPPGSEVREEFGVRWPDSPTVWSYDDRDEAEEYAGDTIEGQNRGEINRRLHIVTPWSPSVLDTKEGS